MTPSSKVRHRPLVALAAGLVLLAAGCGSDTASAPDTEAPPAEVSTTESAVTSTTEAPAATDAPETTAVPTTIAPTTVPTTDAIETPVTSLAPSTTIAETTTTVAPAPAETIPPAVGVAEMPPFFTAALLTPGDIDPSFQTLEWTQPVDASACGVDLAALVPVANFTGTFLSSVPLNLSMLEEIRGYATVAEAEQAFRDDLPALTCGDVNAITYGTPVDVAADLGIGFPALAVPITAPGIEGVLIVVQASNAVVSFQFLGSTGAAAAAGIATPIEVARRGLEAWLCCDE